MLASLTLTPVVGPDLAAPTREARTLAAQDRVRSAELGTALSDRALHDTLEIVDRMVREAMGA